MNKDRKSSQAETCGNRKITKYNHEHATSQSKLNLFLSTLLKQETERVSQAVRSTKRSPSAAELYTSLCFASA